MTLRISPSIVSSYEYWRSLEDDPDGARYRELVAQIKGEPFEPSDAMRLGSAFHEALTWPVIGEDVVRIVDDGREYAFDAAALREVRGNHPEGIIREIEGELSLPEIDVVMALRVDGISGNEVHEVKTTSCIVADRYQQSIQWRCYLLAFEASVAVYHVCKLNRDRSTDRWCLGDYFPFREYRYPKMREHVVRRVAEVADFIHNAGLSEYRQANERRATCLS